MVPDHQRLPQVLVDQRQHRGQGGARQICGDHHPHPRQAVHDSTGDQGEQRHGRDLGDDRAADAKSGAGQPEHEHD
jgi:hypothetical protein